MFKKFRIKGEIEILTGMHIGTGGAFSAIGAVDSPVIRDTYTNRPILPGSSLKGKLRTLVAMKYNDKLCNVNGDCKEIKELFGGTIDDVPKTSKLIFSDSVIINLDELESLDVKPTEVKFENTINRITGVANPRQIERVIRGTKFDLNIVYNCTDEKKMESEMEMLCEGLKMLKYDYIGGSGSRGYGKITFNNISFEQLTGSATDKGIIENYSKMFEEI